MSEESTFDVIVVGAGLAGLAAAYTMAREGLEVLVLERGEYPGSKNVTGGRLYLNPIRDMTLPMLAAMRAVTDLPMDVHAYWGTTLARTLDVPEIVRVAAPIYFKVSIFGAGVTPEDKFMQALRVVETIERYFPEAKQSEKNAKGAVVPAPPGAWKMKA